LEFADSLALLIDVRNLVCIHIRERRERGKKVSEKKGRSEARKPGRPASGDHG
jgi:hypothetical protein